MPNWILNKLHITGSAKQREIFREAARCVHNTDKESKPITYDLQFSSFFPPPPLKRLKIILAHDLDPAYPIVMKWQTRNWGCKWDIIDARTLLSITKSSLVYKFTTAWAPPAEFVRRASLLYSDLHFSLHSMLSDGTRCIQKFAAGHYV